MARTRYSDEDRARGLAILDACAGNFSRASKDSGVPRATLQEWAAGRVPDSAARPPLRLEWRSPAELAENPRNWRRHPGAQTAALADVISEVGWAGACLYNEATGRLIDGHARRKVALEQGCEKVPVLVGSWDEAQEAKILATLDPLAAMAEADAAALDDLLKDVTTSSEALGAMLAELSSRAAGVPAGDVVDDPAGEWQGMPEFQHGDGTAFRSITIHLADDAAANDLAELLGQPISAQTKYLYHPKREAPAAEHYADES